MKHLRSIIIIAGIVSVGIGSHATLAQTSALGCTMSSVAEWLVCANLKSPTANPYNQSEWNSYNTKRYTDWRTLTGSGAYGSSCLPPTPNKHGYTFTSCLTKGVSGPYNDNDFNIWAQCARNRNTATQSSHPDVTRELLELYQYENCILEGGQGFGGSGSSSTPTPTPSAVPTISGTCPANTFKSCSSQVSNGSFVCSCQPITWAACSTTKAGTVQRGEYTFNNFSSFEECDTCRVNWAGQFRSYREQLINEYQARRGSLPTFCPWRPREARLECQQLKDSNTQIYEEEIAKLEKIFYGRRDALNSWCREIREGITPSPTPTPGPGPTSFNSCIVDSIIKLEWDKADAATFNSYEVCYSVTESQVNGSSCQGISIVITDINTLNYVISGLSPSTQYYFNLFLHTKSGSVLGSGATNQATCPVGQVRINGSCVGITGAIVPTPPPNPTETPIPLPTSPGETPLPTGDPWIGPPGSVPFPWEEWFPIGEIKEIIDDVIDKITDIGVEIIESIQRIAQLLPNIARNVTKALAKVFSNPAQAGQELREAIAPLAKEAAIVAANVAAAAVATLSAVAAIGSVSGILHQLPYEISRLWQGLVGVASGRNRKKWGKVIDVATGNPLKGAIVQVIDTQYHKVRDTMITNSNGEFASILPTGSYQFSVKFPGWMMTPQAPLTIGSVYDGGPISVKKENVLSLIVAMRSQEKQEGTRGLLWRIVTQYIINILNRISWPVMIGGLTLNSLVFFSSPTGLNTTIEALYVVLVGLKLFIGLRYKKATGSVTDAKTGDPVDLATVRLYDAATGRMIGTHVTTNSGQFIFLPKPGVYTMKVSREGYETYQESHIVVKPKKEQLAFAVQLRPAQPQQMDVNFAAA